MQDTTSRERVLKSIRNALLDKEDSVSYDIDTDSNVFQPFEEEADIEFAKEFSRIAGQFIYCADEEELKTTLAHLLKEKKMEGVFTFEPQIREWLDNSEVPCMLAPSDMKNLSTAITNCEYLIARFGAILVSSAQIKSRRAYSYAENHIVIAYSNQIVNELNQAIKAVHEKYLDNLPSLITVISGPSRTADIEKTLVLGAHGPKNLYVLFVDKA